MTTTAPALPPASAVRLDAAAPAWAVPITSRHGSTSRTLGVVLIDESGARWQRTVDLERLATVAAAAVGAVAACAAVRRPARVEHIAMGPGGWVSFRGSPAPRVRRRPRRTEPGRPWWAVVLRARRLDG